MFIGDYAGFLEKDDRHVNKAYLLLAAFLLAGCSTGGHGSVMEKVKYDFGIGEAPEGYVSGTDQVYERLKSVGEMEMKRMNADTRLGEVKFREDGLHGTYFKQVKKYESAQALDAQPMSRGVNSERGYYGYVEYRYQIYQSEHRATAGGSRVAYRQHTHGGGGARDLSLSIRLWRRMGRSAGREDEPITLPC
jgi:hypothetical protein